MVQKNANSDVVLTSDRPTGLLPFLRFIAINCFIFIGAMDPDSLVDQCVQKVAQYAYQREPGYDLAILHDKLPAGLHEKIASHLLAPKYMIAVNHTISLKKQPARVLCIEPVNSITDCNYNRFALGCKDKVLLCIIDGNTVKSDLLCPLDKLSRECGCEVEYCRNNRLAIGKEGKIELYDIKRLRLMREFAQDSGRQFLSMAYCGQHRLATANRSEDCIRIWNIKSGTPILQFLNNNPASITSLIYCGNDMLLSGDEQLINVWDIKTGKESISHQSNFIVDSSKVIAVVGNNKFATFLPKTNKIIVRDTTSDDSAIYSMSSIFLGAGAFIINLNEDYFAASNGFKTISIFHKQATKPLINLICPKSIKDMIFCDNRYLIVGTKKGAKVYDLKFIINPTLEDIITLYKGGKWHKKIAKKKLF